MSNSYTLDDIHKELERLYAPLVIDGVVLRNLMRLTTDERVKVLGAIEKVQKSDTSSAKGIEVALNAIKVVIATIGDEGGQRLADQVGEDLGMALFILNKWTDSTSPGEAQNSPA